MIRQPAVAGRFYPATEHLLRQELGLLITETGCKKKVIGVLSPHAGYIYSGKTAGKLFSAIEIPRTVLMLGPNHHGVGSLAALAPEDYWLTPLGAVPVEKRLSNLIIGEICQVQYDPLPHRNEHSLEVQLPFLQYLRPDLNIVPLSLGFGDYAGCQLLAEGLTAAVRQFGEDLLILASSDMSHYETAEAASTKDAMALEHLLAFDPQGMLEICRSKRITMCGVVPAAIMLMVASRLGAVHAELLEYTDSGKASGDYQQVVGYAAATVW